MKTRPSWLITAAVAFACLVLGLLLARPSAAVPVGKAPPPEVGRYQFSVHGPNSQFYLSDTATGRVWYAQQEANKKGEVDYRWVELVPPLPKR